MAIHDALTTVMENTAVLTGVIATNAYDAAGTDVVANQRGAGLGAAITAHLQVTEAYGGGTGSLVLPILVSSNAPTLDGGSLLYLAQLGGATPFSGLTGTELNLGAEYSLTVPFQKVHLPGPPEQELIRDRRYYGVYFIVTGTYTTGKWSVRFGAHKGPYRPRMATIGYAGP